MVSGRWSGRASWASGGRSSSGCAPSRPARPPRPAPAVPGGRTLPPFGMIRGRGTVQTGIQTHRMFSEFGAPEVGMRVEAAEGYSVRLCRLEVVDGVEDDILASGEEA